jgi:hypothetical protein
MKFEEKKAKKHSIEREKKLKIYLKKKRKKGSSSSLFI